MNCQYGHCQNEGKYTPYLFEGKIIYCLICDEHIRRLEGYIKVVDKSEKLRRVIKRRVK